VIPVKKRHCHRPDSYRGKPYAAKQHERDGKAANDEIPHAGLHRAHPAGGRDNNPASGNFTNGGCRTSILIYSFEK
jgi:hypothetical protein